jgi:5-methylthioadenosine/S-adenosylhomocysteine deaminase
MKFKRQSSIDNRQSPGGRSFAVVILEAAWVVPVTAPPIRDGYLEIAGSRIVSVGPAAKLAPGGAEVVDLGGAILMPGFVNPHTHLELTCYAARLKPASFWTWVGKLVWLRSRRGQLQRERQAVVDGAWRSLRAGVTCVGDISRRNLAWPLLKSIPIRKVCFVELLTLADKPPRNPDELREAVQSVVEDELLTVGISPHAPYTVPAEQIRAAVALADEWQRPWTMHLAETRQEVAFLRGRRTVLSPVIDRLLRERGVTSPHQSPVGFLADCVGDCHPGVLAHMNYVEDDEIERLAGMGHVVVYCPRAHRFFGHPPHPFIKMRKVDVRVALGTDSLASNSSLSTLDELHFVHTQVPDAPPPDELLRMATIEGARALGLEERVGSLEVGKQADLAVFPCARDVADPVRALAEQPAAPQAVWVAGRRVV